MKIEQKCHATRARRGMLPISVIAVVLLCGCESAREYSLTYKVWNQAQRPLYRPAPDPKLAVFTSLNDLELLVTYDALSERRDVIERRAYFAFANEAPIAEGRSPQFVSPSLASNMVHVPLYENNVPATDSVAARFPVMLDCGPGFELYREGRLESAHQLPIYDEGIGKPTQIALTPLAVTGDTLLVAGVVATAGAILWIMAGGAVCDFALSTPSSRQQMVQK